MPRRAACAEKEQEQSMTIWHRAAWLAAAFLVALRPPAGAEERFITVASTTSTEQSGLFDFLLPAFTNKTGIAVRVVAVGTGQALKIGEHGDEIGRGHGC